MRRFRKYLFYQTNLLFFCATLYRQILLTACSLFCCLSVRSSLAILSLHRYFFQIFSFPSKESTPSLNTETLKQAWPPSKDCLAESRFDRCRSSLTWPVPSQVARGNKSLYQSKWVLTSWKQIDSGTVL